MLRYLSLVAVLLVPGAALAQQPTGTPTRFVTLLSFGDSHANLLPGGPRTAGLQSTWGGIARAASLIQKERAKAHPVLVLHGGDYSVGDPMYNFFYGVPDLMLMEYAGFAAVGVGNHEFDLGPLALLQSLSQAFGTAPPLPLLSANLDLSDPLVAGLQSYIEPSRVFQAGRLKVGVFGITTPDTMLLSLPDPVVVSDDLAPIATAQALALRAQGCDVVVMLSHLGIYYDWLLAQVVPEVDVVLGAHDHLLLPEPMTVAGPTGPVHLVHSGEFFQTAVRVRLKVDRRGVHVHQYDVVPLDRKVPEDPFVRQMLDGLADQIELAVPGLYTELVAFAADTMLERVWQPLEPGYHDTAVGNLVSDAWRAYGATDVAVQPSGSTAQPIYQGPVLPVDLFRTIGYGYNPVDQLGFRLVKFEMSGAALAAGLEFGLSGLDLSDDLLMQVSGMRYRYDPAAPMGARLRGVEVGGQPLDPTRTYSVTANEFVVGVLDAVFGPGIYQNPVPLGVSEVQVLWQHVAAFGLAPLLPDGRVEALSP